MEERVVTLAEVKEMLEKAETERGELTYEQKLALEHARRFAKYTVKGVNELMADLRTNQKVDALMAVRLADVAPTHADDVRAAFAKARVTLDDGGVQKILEAVKKYQTA